MAVCRLFPASGILPLSEEAYAEGLPINNRYKYKVSLCDGRRGTFSFYRKIYKSAPMLISGWFGKGFTFMLLTLHDGTTAQLQICSSERNVPLLPVDWKKDK